MKPYVADVADLHECVYPSAAGVKHSYTYDYENRLLTRSGTPALSFVYDHDGNRVRKTSGSTTNYLVDEKSPSGYPQVVEELSAVGANPVLVKTYTHGLRLISQRPAGSTVEYYGHDAQGSTRLLMNNAGGVTHTYSYDAFGIPINPSSPPAGNDYLYCGEQFDRDLGLLYLRARYYNPQTGRFWTLDTYEGEREDPLSLHKYLYCSGDPANRVDPSGHGDLTLGSVLISTAIGVSLSAALSATEAYIRGYSEAKIWEATKQGAGWGLVTGPFFVFKTVRLIGIGFGAVMTGMAIGEGQPEIAVVRGTVTALGAAGEVNYYYVSSRQLVGSGPAPGILEVSARVKSTKAVQNFGSSRRTDFVFDDESGRFIMGQDPLGHDGLLAAARIPRSDKIVGGRIWRKDGRLRTDESSGHYGQGGNWERPGIRAKFLEFMQKNGIEVEHTTGVAE